MNKIILIGRLADAPQTKSTQSGKTVTTFRLITNRRYDAEKSDAHTIVAWGTLAENCGRYLVKGQQAAVTGELQVRSYQAKDGSNRYAYEVIADNVEFLAKPKGSADNRTAKMSEGESIDDIFDGVDVLEDDADLPY